MHFTARYVELLDSHPEDCSPIIIGKDSNCYLKNWVKLNLIDPFNCTVPYLENITGITGVYPICDPAVIVADYFNTIEVVHSGSIRSEDW